MDKEIAVIVGGLLALVGAAIFMGWLSSYMALQCYEVNKSRPTPDLIALCK